MASIWSFKHIKRYADTHGAGDDDFNHHEPKAQTVKARGEGGIHLPLVRRTAGHTRRSTDPIALGRYLVIDLDVKWRLGRMTRA